MIKKNVLKQISLSKIEEFATEQGVIFPEDYEKFLYEYNGGFPVLQKFQTMDKKENSSCEIFFGIDDDLTIYKHLTLNEVWQSNIKMDMPEEIYPIGQDGGGNQICICLKGENYGKVYFYDHEWWNEDDEGNITWENLYLIANSFTEFLEKLH
ncbi:SMI1/KNR4 family protein [Runella sp.]|uniref:SMI1/KNR4 family protein n=1 Tax=Runella sp. TaxID=1960881 RepID=UPI003D12E30C